LYTKDPAGTRSHNKSIMSLTSPLPLNGDKEDENKDRSKHPSQRIISTASTIALAMSFLYFASGLIAWKQSWKQASQPHRTSSFLKEQATKTPVLYGHVHVAKTGGTTLNRKMALHFEHVCGHKGYSYDAFRADVRYHAKNRGPDPDHYDLYSRRKHPNEEKYGLYSRDRVPFDIMDEIGYEDCDWVSTEASWDFWGTFRNWPFPVELHVPCREPIDFLLSQCNHKGEEFDCQNPDVEAEITKCSLKNDRFSLQLQSEFDFSLKCFDYSQFDEYTALMEGHLTQRRYKLEYAFRSNNMIAPRKKKEECLWNNPDLLKTVNSYLQRTSDYHEFCNKCMGSHDDLFVAASMQQ